MKQLILALFVEGITDERFLPVLIQRTAEAILLERGRTTTDVLEPILVKSQGEYRSNAERMLNLARENAGYHALIIHLDADYPSAERARSERFAPGLQQIRAAKEAGQQVCECILPVIPIQMIEAWMMADPQTLHSIIGTHIAVGELNLPAHPHQVESIADPKQRLSEAIKRALADRPRRRRNLQHELTNMQELLARQIRIGELRRVPAFAEFEAELSEALHTLRLLRPG